MIDIKLLQVMQYKRDYLKLRGSIPDDALEPATKVILDDFGVYFEKFDEDRIDCDTFISWFEKFRHPNITKEQKNVYRAVLKNAFQDPPETLRSVLLGELHELRLATTIGNIAQKWEDGDIPNLVEIIQYATDRYKFDMGIKAESWIDIPIGDLLLESQDDAGIRWRLECLNHCMRGVRPGDMGIIAARPDKGKTTFFASECTYMAKQLPPDRDVIWLNNEGPGKRIIPRLYQAALGCTMSELIKLNEEDKLIDAYAEAVGRPDKIKVFDVHGYSTSQIEAIIDEHKAGLVVADMVDHFKGFGGEARTDLVLEEMYKWFRERCVKFDCIGFASSQISNDGDGLQFPTLGMLKDSKTGKQGACDFQLMIGASNDPMLASARFLGLPKNKLRREGGPSDPRAECLFEPQKARYSDIPTVE